MKIAYTHHIFSSQKYGGISRYFYELIKHLSVKENVSTKIVSPLYVNEYIKKDNGINKYGIGIPKLPHSTVITRALTTTIARHKIRTLHPDIVHETYYSKKAMASKPAKTIITVHDMTHELFPEYFSKFDRTKRDKALSIFRADHIICISKHTRDDLLNKYPINPNKVSTIYQANSLTQTRKEPIYSFPYLLYVGIRSGYKNFTSFIRAFAQSTKLKNDFHIICFGGGDFSKSEHALFKSLNLNKNTIHHVSGNDLILSNLYKYACTYICPSLYEGFCLPLVEAMSLECPIISSNRSCLPEIASSAAKYFDPDDKDEITEAIESIVYNEEERSLLIKEGAKRCKKFSWELCAEQTFNVYTDILNNKI